MTAITKPADRLTEADIDDEIVIMRLDNGEIYSVSGAGVAIWRLIDGTRDRNALVTAAASEFDAVESEISEDVDELLEQLKAAGLLGDG